MDGILTIKILDACDGSGTVHWIDLWGSADSEVDHLISTLDNDGTYFMETLGRIKIPDSVRVLFLIADCDNVSPAFVSRCSSAYVDQGYFWTMRWEALNVFILKLILFYLLCT